MSGSVYKKVEITGTSADGVEKAVNNALGKAAKTIRNLRWFEVTEIRGAIDKDKVGEWQVTLKAGFRLDD